MSRMALHSLVPSSSHTELSCLGSLRVSKSHVSKPCTPITPITRCLSHNFLMGSLRLIAVAWAPGTTGHRPALLKHAETRDFPKSPIDNNWEEKKYIYILKMLKFPLNKNARTFPTPGEVQAIAQYNLAKQHKSQLLESIYFTSHVAQNSCY